MRHDAGCLPHESVEGHCDRCGTALTGRKRRWCSEGCAQWYYGNHEWGWARQTTLNRDGYRCVLCGDDGTEVDHIRPRRGILPDDAGCLNHQDNLRTLCHACHVQVTNRQRGEANVAHRRSGRLL